MSRSLSLAEIMGSYFVFRSSQIANCGLSFGLVVNLVTQESTRAWLMFARSHPGDEVSAAMRTWSRTLFTCSVSDVARGMMYEPATTTVSPAAIFPASREFKADLNRFTTSSLKQEIGAWVEAFSYLSSGEVSSASQRLGPTDVCSFNIAHWGRIGTPFRRFFNPISRCVQTS